MNVSTRRELSTFSRPFWEVFRSMSGKTDEVEALKSPEGAEDKDGGL